MRASTSEFPIDVETPDVTIGHVEWGGMIVEHGEARQAADPASLFTGLPDNRCQCPHWGYVLKGSLRYRFADREEIYGAGDAYYAPPGHLPVLEAGCEYVEFSPIEPYSQTMEVVGRNMEAMAPEQ